MTKRIKNPFLQRNRHMKIIYCDLYNRALIHLSWFQLDGVNYILRSSSVLCFGFDVILLSSSGPVSERAGGAQGIGSQFCSPAAGEQA